MFLRMIFASIARRRARMLIVFLAIAIGTSMASALINFYYDVGVKMTRELRAYGANLMVAPAGMAADASEAAAAARGATPMGIDGRTRRALERVIAGRSVLAQVPHYYTVGKTRSVYLTVAGTDVEGLRQINSWWKIEGQWMPPASDPPSCMIGRQVARQLGLAPGQELVLRAGAEAAEREYRFRITGIIDTGAAEDNQVFTALPVAWAMSGQSDQVNLIALNVLGTGLDVERLAQTIEQSVSGLRAKPVRRLAQSEGWILAKIQWMLGITTAVILTITALCAMTTLAAMVVERRREMALMKALGAGRPQILQLLLSEALVLGAAGGLVGYGAGLAIAHLLEQNLFKSSITVRPILLPVIMLIAGGLSIIASLLAVRRALEIQPAALLKGE